MNNLKLRYSSFIIPTSKMEKKKEKKDADREINERKIGGEREREGERLSFFFLIFTFLEDLNYN